MSGAARSLLGRGREPGSTARPAAAVKLVGVAAAAAALVLFGRELSLVAAATLVFVWVVLPVEYALAAGHVALVTVSPDPTGLRLVVGAQAGLGVLLVGALWTAAASPTAAVGWVVAYAGLAGGIWYAAAEGGVWLAAALLWVVLAVGAYGLHRHELVTLGLTDGGRNT